MKLSILSKKQPLLLWSRLDVNCDIFIQKLTAAMIVESIQKQDDDLLLKCVVDLTRNTQISSTSDKAVASDVYSSTC